MAAAATASSVSGVGDEKSVKRFRWKDVSSLSELNATVIRFLRGELSTSPWAGAPVDPETVTILEPLIRVNKLGYITSSGQPGIFVFPVRHYKTGVIITPNPRDSTIQLAEIQHGYMTGIINKKKIPDIVNGAVKDSTVCVLIYEYSTGYYTQINAPTSGDVRRSEYLLTLNSHTCDGRKILKTESDLTHNLANIRMYADEYIDAIEDEDLLQEIGEKCVFIVFIHNVVGSLEKPDAGLGLEGKVAGFLSGELRRSVSASSSVSDKKTKKTKKTRKIKSV